MEGNQVFTYQYSAMQNKEIERIRQKYLPRVESPIERLKRLDSKVQSAGQIQALSLGVVGALTFGVGMCIFLGALAAATWIAVLLCVVGSAIMFPAYPVYRLISKSTKERLTPEILRLSGEILKEAQD